MSCSCNNQYDGDVIEYALYCSIYWKILLVILMWGHHAMVINLDDGVVCVLIMCLLPNRRPEEQTQLNRALFKIDLFRDLQTPIYCARIWNFTNCVSILHFVAISSANQPPTTERVREERWPSTNAGETSRAIPFCVWHQRIVAHYPSSYPINQCYW